MTLNDLVRGCPNCGAPIQKNSCEYCGTRFFIPQQEDELEQYRQKIAFLQTQMNHARQTEHLLSMMSKWTEFPPYAGHGASNIATEIRMARGEI